MFVLYLRFVVLIISFNRKTSSRRTYFTVRLLEPRHLEELIQSQRFLKVLFCKWTDNIQGLTMQPDLSGNIPQIRG